MLELSLNETPTKVVISEARRILENGGIIAYPTESFYALGAKINNKTAIEKLYELKKRPLEKAMPVIVGDEFILRSIVKSIPQQAEKLMKEFWPGPLTIIFEVSYGVNKMLTGGKGNVAVRIPGSSFALHLARALNFPITATSANLSGKPPAQETQKVIDYFDDGVDLVIDGGKTPGGKPSTIVDVTITPPKLIRKGGIALKM